MGRWCCSKTALLLLVGLTNNIFNARAQLKVAIAANTQFVMAELQKDFTGRTGITLELIAGSSGKLAAQIENGAPFDLFLSADMNYPATLFKEGFATSAPREYASGSLIICTRSPGWNMKDWKKLLLRDSVFKIAVANPEAAPYGKAAEEALVHEHLLQKVKSKLVYGESISQVNTYITTGAVSMGFTTEALAAELAGKQPLYWVKVDPATYSEIKQGAVLLKNAAGNYTQALRLYRYLFSAQARAIFKRYGYRIR